MNNKVVLAFSGGLDTSFCVPYLKEKGYEVHTVMVNTGGFSAEEEKAIEKLEHRFGDWEVISGNVIIPPIVKEQECELCGFTETVNDWVDIL